MCAYLSWYKVTTLEAVGRRRKILQRWGGEMETVKLVLVLWKKRRVDSRGILKLKMLVVDSWACPALSWQVSYWVGASQPPVIYYTLAPPLTLAPLTLASQMMPIHCCHSLPKPATTCCRQSQRPHCRQLMAWSVHVTQWRDLSRHCRHPWTTCCRWDDQWHCFYQLAVLFNFAIAVDGTVSTSFYQCSSLP